MVCFRYAAYSFLVRLSGLESGIHVYEARVRLLEQFYGVPCPVEEQTHQLWNQDLNPALLARSLRRLM